MKTCNLLYDNIYNINNLISAYQNARKNKSRKDYVIEFEKNFDRNIRRLHNELKEEIYYPMPLKTFILRDPKTRKISKSHFRDRVIHHAICNVIEPIFDKTFIHDSCANRKGKGTLFAIRRFDKFKRKAAKSNKIEASCLKADIRHYFREVNHDILINVIKRKIKDEKITCLIRKIMANGKVKDGIGMPLGNLTSQFFANVYLNELDYFVKHNLKAKYYIRYVDDFVILHSSKEQLKIWKRQINNFLSNNLKLELHPEKLRIIPLSRGIDFVGFRNFYHFRLLRKRNIRKMQSRIKEYNENKISKAKFFEIYQGWSAYTKWADSSNLREKILKELNNKSYTKT